MNSGLFILYILIILLSLVGPWFLPNQYNKLKYTLLGIAVVLIVLLLIL